MAASERTTTAPVPEDGGMGFCKTASATEGWTYLYQRDGVAATGCALAEGG